MARYVPFGAPVEAVRINISCSVQLSQSAPAETAKELNIWVNAGDWLIIQNGIPTKAVSDLVFQSRYTPEPFMEEA